MEAIKIDFGDLTFRRTRRLQPEGETAPTEPKSDDSTSSSTDVDNSLVASKSDVDAVAPPKASVPLGALGKLNPKE